MKLKVILKDLIENGVLGHIIAWIYVIEYQKRDLRHAHVLLIVKEEDKPKSRGN